MKSLYDYGDYELVKETNKAYLLGFWIKQYPHSDVNLGILEKNLPLKRVELWFPKSAIYSTDNNDFIKDWFNLSEEQKELLNGCMSYKDSMEILELEYDKHEV